MPIRSLDGTTILISYLKLPNLTRPQITTRGVQLELPGLWGGAEYISLRYLKDTILVMINNRGENCGRKWPKRFDQVYVGSIISSYNTKI